MAPQNSGSSREAGISPFNIPGNSVTDRRYFHNEMFKAEVPYLFSPRSVLSEPSYNSIRYKIIRYRNKNSLFALKLILQSKHWIWVYLFIISLLILDHYLE